jgi:hypothetical protein
MSKEAGLKGNVEKLSAGSVEFVRLNIELDDAARQQLEADPHGTVRRLLESHGYTVNDVISKNPTPDAIASSTAFHVTAP